MKPKLIKWTILKKDATINRHVLYSEEDLKFFDFPENFPKDQKFGIIQNHFDKFFKIAGKVYSDITNRWMKLGAVEVLYKDYSGDEIPINNEMSYYYFLRNVEEVLKAPIEIVIKDFSEENRPKLNFDAEILKVMCEKCGLVKICGSCDVPETPLSITSDLENTLKIETEQNVKLWRPEDEMKVETSLEEGEIADESYEETLVEDFKEEEIEEEESLEETPLDANNNVEDEMDQKPTFETVDLESVKEFVPKSPEIRATTPAPVEIEKPLTINEQVVEGPDGTYEEPYVPNERKKVIDQRNNILWNRHRTPKPGYLDLDSPSNDEELSFAAVNFNGRKKFLHKLMEKAPEPLKHNIIIPPSVDIPATPSPPPSSQTSQSGGLLKIKRKIEMPRPIRSKV